MNKIKNVKVNVLKGSTDNDRKDYYRNIMISILSDESYQYNSFEEKINVVEKVLKHNISAKKEIKSSSLVKMLKGLNSNKNKLYEKMKEFDSFSNNPDNTFREEAVSKLEVDTVKQLSVLTHLTVSSIATQHHMTDAEFSNKLGHSANYIYGLQQFSISVKFLKTLATTLDLTQEQLYGELKKTYNKYKTTNFFDKSVLDLPTAMQKDSEMKLETKQPMITLAPEDNADISSESTDDLLFDILNTLSQENTGMTLRDNIREKSVNSSAYMRTAHTLSKVQKIGLIRLLMFSNSSKEQFMEYLDAYNVDSNVKRSLKLVLTPDGQQTGLVLKSIIDELAFDNNKSVKAFLKSYNTSIGYPLSLARDGVINNSRVENFCNLFNFSYEDFKLAIENFYKKYGVVNYFQPYVKDGLLSINKNNLKNKNKTLSVSNTDTTMAKESFSTVDEYETRETVPTNQYTKEISNLISTLQDERTRFSEKVQLLGGFIKNIQKDSILNKEYLNKLWELSLDSYNFDLISDYLSDKIELLRLKGE